MHPYFLECERIFTSFTGFICPYTSIYEVWVHVENVCCGSPPIAVSRVMDSKEQAPLTALFHHLLPWHKTAWQAPASHSTFGCPSEQLIVRNKARGVRLCNMSSPFPWINLFLAHLCSLALRGIFQKQCALKIIRFHSWFFSVLQLFKICTYTLLKIKVPIKVFFAVMS